MMDIKARLAPVLKTRLQYLVFKAIVLNSFFAA